jgi:predicted O-methyltransferase YrrM
MDDRLKLRNKTNTSGLLDLIIELPNNLVMAEIGCYAGESASMFLRSKKIQTFYAIDPWCKYADYGYVSDEDFITIENEFDKNTKGYNVIKLKGTLQDAFDKLPELDMVYIDGNHAYEYVINDIKLALKKIKKNGIICGHDYYDIQGNLVKTAVNEIFGSPDKIFSDTSWLIYLTPDKVTELLVA